AEQVLENPFAAQRRRRAVRVRRRHQDAALAEEASARVELGAERHAAEVTAVDSRNPVMTREALVDERVVGGQQIQNAAVLVNDAREEELRLALEALPQSVVEIRELVRVRMDVVEVPQVEPLTREVLDERRGLRIREHARHLGGKHLRPAELAALRDLEQLVVGDAAPDEERQAARELDVADGVGLAGRNALGLRFEPERERRAREYPAERELDPAFEPGRSAALVEERHQPFDIGGLERAPIRASSERSEDLA